MIETSQSSASTEDSIESQPKLRSLAIRGAIGGVLMGLANLVPGISGGTMLLAAGVYPKFIGAIAEVTTLKFRKHSLVLLCTVALAAAVALLGLAKPVADLVVNYRWMSYSAFIGLTLGGVPVVWRMIGARTSAVWIGAAVGMGAMVTLAVLSGDGGSSSAERGGMMMMFFAGAVGASAMILPGVSGGYLLLVMGVYIPILTGLGVFKDALKARDMGLVMESMTDLVLPLGFGVVLGVVVVSNVFKVLLERYEKATLGVLLGLLVGAVAGLWPFQDGNQPQVGDTFKGGVVTEKSQAKIKPKDWPTEYFEPSGGQVGGSILLILLGLATTTTIARFGQEKDSAK